jgi:hypothetical protein
MTPQCGVVIHCEAMSGVTCQNYEKIKRNSRSKNENISEICAF